eukprot:2814573-Amphidinium_carterae.1
MSTKRSGLRPWTDKMWKSFGSFGTKLLLAPWRLGPKGEADLILSTKLFVLLRRIGRLAKKRSGTTTKLVYCAWLELVRPFLRMRGPVG